MKIISLLIAVAILFGQAAFAQITPGQGNVRDASPQLGSGGRNVTVRPPAHTPNYGNLYITGNVTEGRGFRGFVPYSDPTQFQNRLGSAALNQFEGRAPNLNRVQRGFAPGQDMPFYPGSSTILPLSAQQQGLTMPGSAMPRSQVLPRPEGYSAGVLTPPPLPDVRPTDILVPGLLTPQELQRQIDLATPMEPTTVIPMPPEILPPSEPIERPEPLEPLPELLPPHELEPEEPEDLATRLQLEAERAEPLRIIVGPQEEFAESARRLAEEGRLVPDPGPSPRTQPAPEEPAIRRPSALEDGPIVTDLSGRGTDPYNLTMRSAQRLLLQSRYYEAYQTYSHALTLDPDNPLPPFGQTHALIGAGEFRSAASRLQEALEQFPKMVRLQLDGTRLIGSKNVLSRRRDQLQSLIQRHPEPELQLLAGYVEVLSGNRQPGLELMARSGLIRLE